MSALERQSRLWLPVVAWLIVVALFSTDIGSRSATEGTLADLLRSWWPTVAAWLDGSIWLDSLSFVVRKAAHFTEYGVWRSLVCALVASVDEWHQSLVASRTGSFVDVGIDVAGATAVAVWFHVRGRVAVDR